jgi:DNA-directed RNA polymerase specialized sigma24 family protein
MGLTPARRWRPVPERPVRGPTPIDTLLRVFSSLTAEEQDSALIRLNDIRLRQSAATDTGMERHLRSLQRVADYIGHVPNVAEYKQASTELIAAGEAVESFSRLYRYFGSWWAQVQEVLDLAETTTARGIEARFRNRRVGKTWRHTHQSLRHAIHTAAEYWGHPPTAAEYGWWRQGQMELAKATKADEPLIAHARTYSRRWGSWEAALLHYGFSPEQVAERLCRDDVLVNSRPDAFLPTDPAIAELSGPVVEAALDAEQVRRLRRAWKALPLRSQYVLTARLGLGLEPVTRAEAAAALGCEVSRIDQLQALALKALADEVGYRKFGDLTPVVVALQDTLRLIGRLPAT